MAKKFHSLLDITLQLLKPGILKNHSEYFYQIVVNWASLIDAEWQPYIAPVKLKWLSNTQAQLWVSCSPALKAIEFKYEQENLKLAINRFLGSTVIESIKVCPREKI